MINRFQSLLSSSTCAATWRDVRGTDKSAKLKQEAGKADFLADGVTPVPDDIEPLEMNVVGNYAAGPYNRFFSAQLHHLFGQFKWDLGLTSVPFTAQLRSLYCSASAPFERDLKSGTKKTAQVELQKERV